MHYIAEWEGQLQRESSINSLLTGRAQSKIHRSLSKKLHARPAQLVYGGCIGFGETITQWQL